MLSGPEIKRQRDLGNIVIQPWDDAKLNANSYNLTLDDKLLIYSGPSTHYSRDTGQHVATMRGRVIDPNTSVKHEEIEIRAQTQYYQILDMKLDNPTRQLEIPPEGLVLFPGVIYLGGTVEYTQTMNLVPFIEGRSSIARLGLQIHLTGGWGDCGFQGHWTLELSVVQPLRIYAGVEICQIAYSPLIGESRPYAGKYQQQQRGPTASRLWKDFLRKDNAK